MTGDKKRGSNVNKFLKEDKNGNAVDVKKL